MNTQRNVKTRRSVLSPTVVMLLIGVVVGLVSGGSSAQAQTATPTVDSSLTIAVNGTVHDSSGTISISGNVIVNCTRVIDTTEGSPPLVVLDFDFSNLRGMSGNSFTNLKTYVTGGNEDTQIRPLQASDVITLTCPYYDRAKSILSAKSLQVTATLNFDVTTGKLTSGSITVGDVLPSL